MNEVPVITTAVASTSLLKKVAKRTALVALATGVGAAIYLRLKSGEDVSPIGTTTSTV